MIRLDNTLSRTSRISAINRGASLAVTSNDPVVSRWANLVRVNAVIWRTSIAEAALKIVQSLGFKPAIEDGSYFQSLGETVLHGGDCKALSALLVALLQKLGYDAHASWIEEGDQPLDHVAVMVRINGQWIWAEPSVAGAYLGESPHDAARRLGVNVTTTNRDQKKALLRMVDT